MTKIPGTSVYSSCVRNLTACSCIANWHFQAIFFGLASASGPSRSLGRPETVYVSVVQSSVGQPSNVRSSTSTRKEDAATTPPHSSRQPTGSGAKESSKILLPNTEDLSHHHCFPPFLLSFIFACSHHRSRPHSKKTALQPF